MREKVGEGGSWTEERDWKIWAKKSWEGFFFHFALCVYNHIDDSKEKDRKNWEKNLGKGVAELKKRKGKKKIGEGKDRKNWKKKLGKGAAELKKRKGKNKIGEGYFCIYLML